MKKLYLATQSLTTMFTSNKEEESLNKEALYYIVSEYKGCQFGTNNLVLKEISSKDDIPSEWQEGLIWGPEEEITASSYLDSQAEEYSEYLRLKAKYE